MIKKCSKCETSFVCEAEQITKCHCYTVKLSNEQLKKLKKDFQNCLCHDCLIALTSKTAASK
jgi:hypothetical protein